MITPRTWGDEVSRGCGPGARGVARNGPYRRETGGRGAGRRRCEDQPE
ncbi:hypothetical protein SSBG_05634 [Streptomyces sp. SPB074]|nr:hypothetical protein SSBG_05634 [Streptomyces sp. SPB074]